MSETPNANQNANIGSPDLVMLLMRNTEALVNLNSTLNGVQLELSENRRAAKDADTTLAAKMDNLDRTVGEVLLSITNIEKARAEEIQRIFLLLTDERKERKEVSRDAGKDEKELVREIIREELGFRRQRESWLVAGGKAIWETGGRYIVLAISLLVVALVMKVTGLSLADILGLAGK